MRFRGVPGLVLLEIDPARVPSELGWENLEGGVPAESLILWVGELFPHVYGPLPLDAVISVQALAT